MKDIEEIIDALKQRMKAGSDADLARKLAVDKRTVSAWRARGGVPERYLSIISGADHQTVNTPPLRWGPYEDYAFRLALFRFARVRASVALNSDYSNLYRQFAQPGGFWRLMHKCQQDLAAAMEERTEVLDTALALVLHDDVSAGTAAIERDGALLDGNSAGS